MLDSATKKRIDTARDILVGKVPDPKSQVEQITLALIYKFMDDMDAESEDLGGKRKFFAGEFAKYGWAQLMSPRLGGHEMLALYAEGITRMPENPGVPALFRDIFKNAYLPYRDPETLKAFLKVIGEFTYDHSERLGDAFEYLLSVLGSQGDAGQFRTPRHIIDFIVEVVAPKKGEVILDPACGTAGFLISAFKHIQRSNVDARGASTLTPDDRARLAKNLLGYDISPDMVRLSLANLYLHGFTDPHVHEYDTLTSEDRWNEHADVILANPPFMSPKGGIKPHKRFSIPAKRSEVLFVDYIAEHLTPTGRAGIIVPEGVIFQSQGAYVALRKLLVEQSLVAVVSLPAGCFNPYSGVKTSILILDKAAARRSDSIAFFKVEHDGFDLGAQRRPSERSDLPAVASELQMYHTAIRTGQAIVSPPLVRGRVVPKQTILANPDYSLSAERYREVASAQTSFPVATLSEVCDINPEQADPTKLYPGSHFNYIDISCVENHSGRFLGATKTSADDAPGRARRAVRAGDVLLATVRPNLKAFALLDSVPERAVASTGFAVLRAKVDRLLPTFLIHALRDERCVAQMVAMSGKGAYPSINQADVESLRIVVPPLAMQHEIVAEVESYLRVIAGARAVVENYRPRIAVDPAWPMVALGEVCDVRSGGTPSRSVGAYWNGSIPWVGSTVCKDGEVTTAEEYITDAGLNDSAAKLLPKDTTLIALVGATIGKTGLLKFESTTNQNIAGVVPKSRDILDPVYLFHAVQRLYPAFLKLGEGKFRMANLSFVREQQIPVPPIDVQRAIVAEIEAEQGLVTANRELVVRCEHKIQAALARVWGGAESVVIDERDVELEEAGV